jgi:competence protein ComEC
MPAESLPPPDDRAEKPPEPVWREFARAPLAPVAVAATAGLIADRYGSIPVETGWLVGLTSLLVWVVVRSWKAASSGLWLWLAAGGLAAAYHHESIHVHGARRERPAADVG